MYYHRHTWGADQVPTMVHHLRVSPPLVKNLEGAARSLGLTAPWCTVVRHSKVEGPGEAVQAR